MDGMLMFALVMVCMAPLLGAIAAAVCSHLSMRRDAAAYRAAVQRQGHYLTRV